MSTATQWEALRTFAAVTVEVSTTPPAYTETFVSTGGGMRRGVEVRARLGTEAGALTTTGGPTAATLTVWRRHNTRVDRVGTLTLAVSADVVQTVTPLQADGWASDYFATVSAFTGGAAVKAERDFGTVDTFQLDTVIEATTAGTAGNSLTLALVAGGSGTGVLSRIGNAFTFTFETAVTTVADFEAAVTALAGADDLIAVKTPGTGATVLVTADAFAATALAGGLDIALSGIVDVRAVGDV